MLSMGKYFIFFVLFSIFYPLNGYCFFESDLIKDINHTYSQCNEKTNKEAGGKSSPSTELICKALFSDVIQKHFPVGSSADKAIEILNQEGFEMVEYRIDSWRKLPDGALVPYNTVGFKIGATKSLRGERKVRADKSTHIDFKYLFMSPIAFIFSSKKSVIHFNIDENGNILDIQCSVYTNTI
jgi:hypothetical protein